MNEAQIFKVNVMSYDFFLTVGIQNEKRSNAQPFSMTT